MTANLFYFITDQPRYADLDSFAQSQATSVRWFYICNCTVVYKLVVLGLTFNFILFVEVYN